MEQHGGCAEPGNLHRAKFYEQIWKTLKPDEKVIVLYHQDHLYKNFESYKILRTPTGPVSVIAPRTWYSVFLAEHGEAESVTREILFDEKDELYQPNGVLRFTRRQYNRYPNEAWAIDVRGMQGIDVERGENGWIFGPTSFENEGMNYNDRYFYEIVDGVIYSPRAPIDYHVGSVTDYLLAVCPSPYDGQSLLPEGAKNP